MALHDRLGRASNLGSLDENMIQTICSFVPFRLMAGIRIGAPDDPSIHEAVRLARDDEAIIIRDSAQPISWPGHLTIHKSLHFIGEWTTAYRSDHALILGHDEGLSEKSPVLYGKPPALPASLHARSLLARPSAPRVPFA